MPQMLILFADTLRVKTAIRQPDVVALIMQSILLVAFEKYTIYIHVVQAFDFEILRPLYWIAC